MEKMIDLHELENLPDGSVIAVMGAGGKTTSLHQLSEHYHRMGKRVLATTSTHMAAEPGLLGSLADIREALDQKGFAFAGRLVTHKGHSKVSSLPSDILHDAISSSDITIIEADGSRRLPFKAPKDTEPVIPPETTHLLLLGGMWAVGKTLGESAYNLPGIFSACPACSEETIITPELMAEVYSRTYLRRMASEHPDLPLFTAAGQTDTPERRTYADRFLKTLSDLRNHEPLPDEKNVSEQPPENEPAGGTDSEDLNLTVAAEEKKGGRIFALYLAAGFGRRFGSNKLLTPYQGKPLYRHMLDKLAGIKASGTLPLEILVITQYDEILTDMKEAGISCIRNEHPEYGQSASLHCGISWLEKQKALTPEDYLVFFVGDQPRMKPETLMTFFRRLRSDRPMILAFANEEGRPVNPAAFSASLIDDMKTLSGDTGARVIFRSHADGLVLFTDAGTEELTDIDSPEDIR